MTTIHIKQFYDRLTGSTHIELEDGEVIYPMKRPDLDAIEARASNTTKGDWQCRQTYGIYEISIEIPRDRNIVAQYIEDHDDAVFIATAHQDIPTLLAYVRQLETQGHAMITAYQAIARSSAIKESFLDYTKIDPGVATELLSLENGTIETLKKVGLIK